MILLLIRTGTGGKAQTRSSRRSKSLFGVPLGPFADELSAALLIKDHRRALSVLLRAADGNWKLADIEELVIAAAVTRLGELWLRGRLSDPEFDEVGGLAERVERSFRHRLVNRGRPAAPPSRESPLRSPVSRKVDTP